MQHPTFTIPEASWIGTPAPTGALRFVTRDGRNVLQQQWSVAWGNDADPEEYTRDGWFDVPLVTE